MHLLIAAIILGGAAAGGLYVGTEKAAQKTMSAVIWIAIIALVVWFFFLRKR